MTVKSIVIFNDGSGRRIPITMEVSSLLENEEKAIAICYPLVLAYAKKESLDVQVESIIV
jgi:hypothetical protein